MKIFILAFGVLSLPMVAFAGGYGRSYQKRSYAPSQPSYEASQRTSRYMPYRYSTRYSDSLSPVVSTKLIPGNDMGREDERQSAARNKLMRLRSIGR